MHLISLSLVFIHGEVVVGTAAHSVGARLMLQMWSSMEQGSAGVAHDFVDTSNRSK